MSCPVLVLGLLLCSVLFSCASQPTLSGADGIKIAYEVLDEGSPASSLPTLVFIHGWASDRTVWGELPERLGSDYRVVTLDLPGHGQSGRDRDNWSVVALGADVVAVSDQLNLQDVVLIGHSMGATVALSAAFKMPGRVRGVIAVDAMHEMDGPIPAEMVESYASLCESDWRAAIQAIVSSLVRAKPRSKLSRSLVARAQRTDPVAAAALMRSFGGLDLGQLAKKAGVPIRAVNAAPYAAGGETLTEANQALVDFDAVLIDDVGHYLQLERPAEVEQAIRGFLDEFSAQLGSDD